MLGTDHYNSWGKGDSISARVISDTIIQWIAEFIVVDLLELKHSQGACRRSLLKFAISPEMKAKVRITLGNPIACLFGHDIFGDSNIPVKGITYLSSVH